MDTLTDKLNNLWFGLLEMNTPNTWLQLAVIAVALVVAYIIARRVTRALLEHSKSEDIRGLKKITLRSLQRIIFPLSAFIIVLIGYGSLHALSQPAQILRIAMTMLMSLAGIRLVIYMLRKGYSPSPTLKAWENIISTTIWVVVALYLLDWLPAITESMEGIGFKLGNNRVSLLSLVNFILLIALFFTLAVWISGNVERRMQASQTLNASLKVALAKLIKFIFITFAILIALDTAGIDLTALTVFGGALGVGLGFGLQRITSNFISGFILLFDKSIKPGDVISIGDKFGWVQELRARYIVVRDRDGVDTLIPNENLVTTDVINWSYSDRNVRLKCPISISYGDDPEQAMQLMVEAAKETSRVLDDPVPVARLMKFGDNGIELECRVWINDPQTGINNVRSDLNLNMWRKFRAAGITIPFPQRDLYIKQMPAGERP